MRTNRLIVAGVAATALLGVLSCNLPDYDTSPLTDARVEAYLKAYAALKVAAPDMLAAANSSGGVEAGQAGFAGAEGAIKAAGLKDFADFVTLNARIGGIIAVLSAESAVTEFGSRAEDGGSDLDAAIAQLTALVDDPATTEEARAGYLQSIAEMEEAKSSIASEWDRNSGWAKLVIDGVKSVTGKIVSEADVEVVTRWRDRIMEAYAGFPPPSGN